MTSVPASSGTPPRPQPTSAPTGPSAEPEQALVVAGDGARGGFRGGEVSRAVTPRLREGDARGKTAGRTPTDLSGLRILPLVIASCVNHRCPGTCKGSSPARGKGAGN